MSEPAISRRTYIITYVALLCLTAATTGVAFLDLGPLNTVMAIAFAGAKALLIALFFMHLVASPALTRVIAIGALIWFLMLLSLTMGDYLTRAWVPVPGK